MIYINNMHKITILVYGVNRYIYQQNNIIQVRKIAYSLYIAYNLSPAYSQHQMHWQLWTEQKLNQAVYTICR